MNINEINYFILNLLIVSLIMIQKVKRLDNFEEEKYFLPIAEDVFDTIFILF